MKKLSFVLIILITVPAFSQEKARYVYMHVSDKTVSLFPFYKVFGSNLDPAITFGGALEYLNKGNSAISQQVQATWYSAEMIGAGITLSSSMVYRYQFSSGLYTDAALGIGGTGAISARKTYSLDKNGYYENVTPVHWTLGLPVDLGIGYAFDKIAIYCRYRYMVEGSYTDILPVLPTSLLSVGIKYLLNGKEE